MIDVALTLNPGTLKYDISILDGDLLHENGLRTAVILSIGTDALAQKDDVLPDGGSNRRGFWDDAYSEWPDDVFGSRLWLLSRSKQSQSTLKKAQEYAAEACQWMVADGLAASTDVIATWERQGMLGLKNILTKADGSQEIITLNQLWMAS